MGDAVSQRMLGLEEAIGGVLGSVAGPWHAQDFHLNLMTLGEEFFSMAGRKCGSQRFPIRLHCCPNPAVLPVCIRVRTRNLGKEEILLLIKHPEPHFPFWDDSVSSM